MSGFTRMAQGRVPFNAVAACGAPPGFDTPEAAFNAALLREQYRSLARLGPYVHGIVIVAALAFFGATPTGSLLTGILLPTALIAVSVFRLSSWFKARAGVELEALDRVRRKVRAASARADADVRVCTDDCNLDLAERRRRIRAGAPRRLGRRRRLRDVSEQDRGRGQYDRNRRDRVPHHRVRGSRL